MVSHEYRCIFIHIPKTAGTSIENKLKLFDVLKQGVQDHRTIREMEPCAIPHLFFLFKQANLYLLGRQLRNTIKGQQLLSQQQYKSYFKFAFVRNSWSRVFSWYKNVMRDDIHKRELRIADNCSFGDFLHRHGKQEELKSQLFWITNRRGQIPMDFIGRFEHLERDLSYVFDVLGIKDKNLPRLIVGDGQPYAQSYDSETREIVARRYKDEISLFRFRFGE